MAAGHYDWQSLSTERQMKHSCFMGPWQLYVIENGWNGDNPIWQTIVKCWNQQSWEYEITYRAKFQHTDREAAKSHLEDWYANNVLFEHLMLGKDDGESSKDK